MLINELPTPKRFPPFFLRNRAEGKGPKFAFRTNRFSLHNGDDTREPRELLSLCAISPPQAKYNNK